MESFAQLAWLFNLCSSQLCLAHAPMGLALCSRVSLQRELPGVCGTDPARCCRRGLPQSQQWLCRCWHLRGVVPCGCSPGVPAELTTAAALLPAGGRGALEPLGAGGQSSPVGVQGERSPLLRAAAGEDTLETALGVKSSLCSSDITHGCHGNVSHGEGVIGERSGAGMLGSFWSCANLHGGGGDGSGPSPVPVCRGSPPHPLSLAAWPGHPLPISLQLPGAPAWGGQRGRVG